MAPTKSAKASITEKLSKSASSKAPKEETTISPNSPSIVGKGKSGFKLVVMPVSSEQSNLFNVKELSKQFTKLVSEASKAITELKEVNEETVSVVLQSALESVYSYALPAANEGKKGKKAKKVKDPNAPKKPLSNYMVYCMRFRSDLQAKNPNAKPTEISKMLGAQWNTLTPEQKAKFIDTTVSA
jgi:hypothetical protein